MKIVNRQTADWQSMDSEYENRIYKGSYDLADELDKKYPCYNTVAEWFSLFLDDLNNEFEEETEESAAFRFETVAVSADANDTDTLTETKGIYHHDFRIIMTVGGVEVTSQRYRLSVNVKTGKSAELGICAESEDKKAWDGYIIHSAGKSTLASDLYISPTNVTVKKQKFIQIDKKTTSVNICTQFTVISIPTGIFIFIEYQNKPINILSFMLCFDILNVSSLANAITLSNGWHNGLNGMTAIKKDSYRYIYQTGQQIKTFGANPVLKDFFVAEYDRENKKETIRWYVPYCYVTTEPKTSHFDGAEPQYGDLYNKRNIQVTLKFLMIGTTITRNVVLALSDKVSEIEFTTDEEEEEENIQE